MKLHLPKLLLTAVLATAYTYTSSAATGWGTGNNNGKAGAVYYIDKEDEIEINATGRAENILSLVADAVGVDAHVTSATVKQDITMAICVNPWPNPYRVFDSLLIDTLNIQNDGAIDLQVQDGIPVTIKQVSGVLKSVTNTSQLTIGTAGNTTELAGSMTNTGSMTLNGTFTFDVSSFDNYVRVEGSGGTTIVEKNERGNGFITYVGADYYLLNNSSGTQLITSAATITTSNGLETKKLDDQSVVVTAGQTLSSIYAVVSGTETYGGDSATVDAGATEIQVSKGAELVLAGDYDIRKITGEGTLTLAKNYTLANGVHSVGEGTLKINSGVTLTVGGGTDQNAGIASYEAVELAGGTLKFHCNGGTVHNLTVNSESTLRIQDMAKQTSVIKLDETTTLNDKLNLTHGFKGTLNIVKLTGTGDLQTTLYNNGYDDALCVTIDSIDKYSGTITYDNSANRGNAKLTLGADANSVVNLGTTVSVINAPVDLNGQFTLDDKNGTFELYGEVSGLTDGDNGFRLFTGDQYYLVHGDESTSIDTTDISSVTLTSDVATTLDKETVAGSVIFKGEAYVNRQWDNVYYVNTTVDSTVASDAVFKVNAEGAVLNVVGTLSNKYISYVAGSVNVADTGTLIIDTTTGDAANVLLNTTGEGDITLSTSVGLTGNVATKAAGTLTITNKAQLNLGSADLWDKDNNTATETGADISSFTAVTLDDGTIRIQNPSATIKNLTVTANGGVIDANDIANDPERYKINLLGNTTLNGVLTYKNEWNTYTEIENLTGSGNLIIDGSNRSAQDNSTFSILKTTNYDGIVQMTNKANNMSLKVAQNLGLDVKVGTTSGEIDLTGIGSGNTITLAAAVGGIKSGTVAADVVVKNEVVGNQKKAGMEILTATDNTSIVYTGKFSGDGNYIIGAQKTVDGQQVNVTTSTTFSGDTSGFTGQLRVSKGEQNITFTGSATAVNSSIDVDNNATANVTLDHTQAATVTKALNPGGTLNLTVKNTSAEGVTFTNTVKTNTTTIAADTKVTFNDTTDLGDLTLAAGASVTTSGALTLGNITLDLTNYEAGSYTLVSATGNGSISWNEEWTRTGTLTDGLTANVGMVNNVLQLTINAPEEEITSVNAKVTGVVGYNADTDMLTLQLDQKVTSGTMVSLTLITDEVLADIQTALGDADDMFRITVQYDETHKVVAESFDQVVFYNEKGQGYWGEMVDLGGNVGTKLAYKLDRIPEPTTTTLSLLALMGLAARRRRK